MAGEIDIRAGVSGGVTVEIVSPPANGAAVGIGLPGDQSAGQVVYTAFPG